jgi:asparagine synthase (glutamine-hydrolysing)
MCGLAGAAGLIDDSVIRTVGDINDAQAHRGPDAEGTWTSGLDKAFGVSLGHRRLAIVDLSPGGAQPMKDEGTGNVLVFNGEIYNHGALRNELKALGVQFLSSSDTEVILRAYGAWGLDAVSRFRGIFAFALWDARERVLHLVRDPMGIKPLYWNVRGKTVYFASELRALLAAGAEPRLDPSGVASFLWHGFVVGPQTMIKGVRLLPAASLVTLRDGDLTPTPRTYWNLPTTTETRTSRESVAETLRESVRMQLMSDVPLGVFLSGGIDSTSVAVMACDAGAGVIKTFNMGFDDPSLDESQYASDVAKVLGTDHHSLRLSENDFRRQLPQALEAIDQPTFDGVNTYLLSRAVREAGITVALAGIGGDELFGGYRSFVDLPRVASISRVLSPMGGVARALMGAMTSTALAMGVVPPQTRWGKVADVVSSGGDFVDLYQTTYGLFSAEFFSRLARRVTSAGDFAMGLTGEQRAAKRASIGDQRSLHAVSELELYCYVRERLMRDVDAASMAVSLELRVPLLDHVVIEAVSGLRDEDRFRPLGRKTFLRQTALARLDPRMFERPKSGFVLPIDAWCRRGMREQMDSVYNDEALCERVGVDPKLAATLWRSFLGGSPGLYWSRVWAIFVLLHWSARHKASL